MRLKSYFAPTVQTAIALARKEFGDEITLVTSHVAPADARHLGEYEVVFDVQEEVTPALAVQTAAPVASTVIEEKTVAAPFSAFQETLLDAVASKPAAEEEKAQKLRQIRFTLIELGIEAGLTRAIMSMLEGSIGKRSPRASIQPVQQVEALAEPVAGRTETVALSTAIPEILAFEVPENEQAALNSGKVVAISKRRDSQPTVVTTERHATPAHNAAAKPVASGPTAAELAFMSSLSEPQERLAVGC